VAETLLTVKRLSRSRPLPVALFHFSDAPEELEFLPGAKTKPDMSLIYPVDPKQLPKELAGVGWPPKS
jgi:hypothetical protein